MKISYSLWNFPRKQRRRDFLLLSGFLQRKKLTNQTSKRACKMHCYAMHVILCSSIAFLHFKNIFISHVREINNCFAWVKPMIRNCNEIKIFVKTLCRSTTEKLAHPHTSKPQRKPHVYFLAKSAYHSYYFDVTPWN